MSLRHALLAILRVGPMSGYDIQKRFSQSVGHVWHAPDSQIYPELRKLETTGLIHGQDQTRGTRGRRRVYHVTDAGEREFYQWMDSRVAYSRVRDPAHLRSAYLESATPDGARRFLADHIAHWESELEQWRAELAEIEGLTSPVLVRRLSATPEAERAATIAFKRFAYEGLVDRALVEIAWARRGLDLVDDLHGPGTTRE